MNKTSVNEKDRLLEIVSGCREEEYNKMIAQEKNWAILFHLSHIRENLVRWLPIRKQDRILEIGSGYGELSGALSELAGSVTCVEADPEAVKVAGERHKEKTNIQIHQGIWQDMEILPDQKYDWIFLAGTIEKAGEQMEGLHPQEALLSDVKKYLAPGGRVVIAADNRLGLKYFAGCRDAYSDTYFRGIEGTDQKNGTTFSGPELKKMAAQCGYRGCSCYYPYPDYRLPMTIYSDDYLPKVGELWDNLRNFDRERYLLFDESKAFDRIIADGLFPVFANSFLMILTEEEMAAGKRVVFSKFSDERDRRFAIRTDILLDEKNQFHARKAACYPEGRAHIDALPIWKEKLEQVYAGGRILLNRCQKEPEGVELEFVTGQTLEELADEFLLKGDVKKAVNLLMSYIDALREAGRMPFCVTPEFEQVFGEVLLPEGLTCCEVTDIDMVAGNAMIAGENWIHMDYEWTFAFPIPVNYVIYRVIQNYLYGNVERSQMYHELLYKKAGLTEQEITEYTKMEQSFQSYITGNLVPLRLLYEEVSPGCISFEAEEAHRRELAAASSEANEGIDIFVDTFEIAMTGIHVNGWAVSKADRRVRFELLDEKETPLDVISTEYLYRRDVVDQFKLSGKNSKAGFHLECRLPAGEQKNRRFTLVAKDGIHVCRFEIPVEKLRIKQSRIGKKLMDLRGTRDVIRYIAPKEMGLLGEARQYRVEDQRFDTWRMAHRLSESQKERQRREVMERMPKICAVILDPTDRRKDSKRTMDSILRQTYPATEIIWCIGKGSDRAAEVVKKYYPEETGIRIVNSVKETKSSDRGTMMNLAARISDSEFLMFLNPGDALEESAFYEFTKSLNQNPAADMIYCDSDQIDWERKEFFDPQFKPDYGPYTLHSGNYMGNSVVIGKNLMQRAEKAGEGFGEQAIYDLILKCSDRADLICHIPKLLYHEKNPMSRNLQEREELCSKWDAGKKVLEAYFDRHQQKVKVEWANYPLRYRVKLQVQGEPLVSVIIPNQDHIQDLEQCLSSIAERTTYPNLEVLVVENNSRQERTFSYYQKMEKRYPFVKLLTWEREFNYSAINNYAAREAAGKYLIFLNNDTEILTPDWIEEMLSVCQQPNVGIVGAKLYYPDGTIQHAGVILGLGNVAGHLFVKEPGNIPGYMGRACITQNLSAVTAACLMTKREVFEQTGGFDESLQVALNDVDYCMKVILNGSMVVWTPNTELYHYESKSRGLEDTPEKKARYDREVARFMEKWGQKLEEGDPFYNPNLSRTSWNCRFRIPRE